MAVRHGYGKIAGADALVFAYDTGDVVNSYKGEPTENLAPAGGRTGTSALPRQSYHVLAWTYSLETNVNGRADVIKMYINPPGDTSQPYTDFGFQSSKPGGSVVGDVYTISFDYYVAKGNSVPSFGSVYADGYKSPTSANVATTLSDTTKDLGNGWYRRTRTVELTAAGNTFWRGGISSNNLETEAYIDNIQLEYKGHETPFVNGTRSATEGLLDLTGNNTVDLNTVSFDSNAQITFDGTDDVVTTSFPATTIPNVTIEAVVYRNQTTGRYEAIVQNNTAGDDALYVNPSGFLMFWPCSPSSLTVPTGQWSHVAVSYDGTTLTYIVNGTTQAVTATCSHITDWDFLRIGGHSTTDSERWIGEVPVAKVYNRALTTAELKNNFNHYKTRFSI